MRRFGKFFTDVVAPVLLALWVAYLGYGAIAGAAGYRVLAELRAEADEKQTALDEIIEKRRVLERHADLLNPKSVDPDMLDERIRAVLGYAHPDDIVVPREELQRMLKKARDSAS
ncbi:MAG TPA: septum formation initiator family protein [Parvularculaceae bacterium]|nr:septum formation initiator family protein [Caulobacterales bacterium]HOP19121.1 septum formation initiator family protein [Amphiplicatus sp.]HPE29583.1 septum formation initiator family protein [Parvularculaceae bacterium]HRX38304.1 septum formation initiator family protein [Parvularculaceae bacterium]